MIRLLGQLPNKLYLAFSGGVDSMAVLNFLQQGRKDITLVYFNHGTAHGDDAERFARQIANEYGLELIVGGAKGHLKKGESKEAQWRNWRYELFHGLDGPVVMCHHLDDVIETWIFTALNGIPRTIPYSNGNVIRPFLLTKKQELVNWCNSNDIGWVQDLSNKDVSYARNRIRHNIVPECLVINPGLHRVIRRKVEQDNVERLR